MSKTPDLFANLSAPKNASETNEEFNIESEELSEAERAAAAAEPEEVEEDELEKVDELTLLKQRAKIMGINPGNMGVEALKAKINAKLNDEETDEKVDPVPSAKTVIEPVKSAPKNNVVALRQYMKREQTKLVRVRITNLDPKDKDLPGNIFTVANEYLGTVSKYVPFGEATENGYHLPYCLYTFLKDMQFTQVRVVKKAGKEHVETKDVRKFAIEVLPPLTQAELNRLKTAQLAAGSID